MQADTLSLSFNRHSLSLSLSLSLPRVLMLSLTAVALTIVHRLPPFTDYPHSAHNGSLDKQCPQLLLGSL